MTPNPELELCINDLVYPTEKAETLLETLSNEQLSLIEDAVNKIKSKKLNQEKKGPENTINNNKLSYLSIHEPTTEVRDGVEWVSFVYSHHRTLRKYCIRTDLEQVDIDTLDEKFKKENCVYPRANLPREIYQGNRWTYETECNVLGWKLAHLNIEELAGKRGLIQRAVDSYRNRYPSMRSRRVARQEKLLKGTLRKRKHREEDETAPHGKSMKYENNEKIPKTIIIEEKNGNKCRIRINIESVLLDAVDIEFKKSNCVFPRAMSITSDTPNLSQRRLDEIKCNEIGWKLAWLNPRQLANKKNLLQRALDTYRYQFTTDLKPRKFAPRLPPSFTPESSVPLTQKSLEEKQKEFDGGAQTKQRRDSCYSGTTVTLDFHDYCFSPPPEEEEYSNALHDFILAPPTQEEMDSLSEESGSQSFSYTSTPSPEALIHLTELYQQAFLSAALFDSEQQDREQEQESEGNTELLANYEKGQVDNMLSNQLY
ncbi:hypothetical protein G6F57_011305 [Rhizopus arrhizus]|uniref:DUF8032 domain-containing protein n=1 Tax=Rhizopus oryzae TaxID=64495 RepID=A0A9P6XAK9_RHIOR|nr:hypothetical protein G6F23_008059 [Rhizopus arrhizus]KAG1410663.1 hypothetical protein G6F58_008991 [Rhizopus delemar]KAG0764213.1 hypothetical protein G6F24_005391 [Rhizopus arrhizus]KAG0790366.1 hypothetical protein G6F22_006433 [Rhizopus arrhizus]KAG0790958.1 hypothetical protein G6F21_005427 [Rhizopus arrhizus]